MDFKEQDEDTLGDLCSVLNELGFRGDLKGFSYRPDCIPDVTEYVWRALALSSLSLEDLELTATYADYVGRA